MLSARTCSQSSARWSSQSTQAGSAELNPFGSAIPLVLSCWLEAERLTTWKREECCVAKHISSSLKHTNTYHNIWGTQRQRSDRSMKEHFTSTRVRRKVSGGRGGIDRDERGGMWVYFVVKLELPRLKTKRREGGKRRTAAQVKYLRAYR